MTTDLVYRTVYVMAPRAVAAMWWHEPWDVVLAAAERGTDGLSVQYGRPRIWQGPQVGYAPDPPDVAFLAQGQHEWAQKTVLHQQNWVEPA